MKSTFKYLRLTWYALLSMGLSLLVLYSILSVLTPKTVNSAIHNIRNQTANIIKPVQTETQILSRIKQETQCLKDTAIMDKSKCYHTKKKQQVLKETKKPMATTTYMDVTKKITKKIRESNSFIQLVYLLVVLSLILQMMTYLISRHYPQHDSIRAFFIHNRDTISDWSTTTPATVGVLGTAFAFAAYATSAGSSMDLMEAFRANVHDAVATTLTGGMVYTINMLLNIPIQMEESYETKT